MFLAAYLVLIGIAAAAAVIDLRTGLVPNRLTYPAILTGLIYWPAAAGLADGWSAVGLASAAAWIAMLAGLVPMAILVTSGGLGGGDMKLMAAVGAWSASWSMVLSTMVYALIVALLIAVVVMIRRGVVKRTLGRVAGAALLAASRSKPVFSDDAPRVPFAVAVAVGAVVAGLEHLLDVRLPWSWLTA